MRVTCGASRVGMVRRRTAAAAAVALLAVSSGAALGQGSVRVRLPDLSGLSRSEANTFLQTLARVNVITSNCPGWEISHGEWVLLTGTGDALAARLGLDPALYERRYFGRAFELLNDPANCDRIGPEARPLLRRLMAMGGSTDAIVSGIPALPGKPAAAGANPPGKTKGANKGNSKGQGKGQGQGSGKGNSNGKGQGKGGSDKQHGRSGKR